MDTVNKPSHYNDGEIECIVYLEDNMSFEAFQGYLEGNCKKYLHRWRYKGKPVEDLKKAQWYLNRLIKHLEVPVENKEPVYSDVNWDVKLDTECFTIGTNYQFK